MDRPAQKLPEPAGAADSPLSFPVEAPKLAGVEPGAGAPAGSAAEATRPRQGDPLAFPSEPSAFSAEAAAAQPPAEPLAFPSESPVFSAEAAAAQPRQGDPLAFPSESPVFSAEAAAARPRQGDPLAFPSEPSAFSAEAAAAPPLAEPLAFPAAATPPADPPLFPAEAPTAPPPADPLAFPTAATPPPAEPPAFPAAAAPLPGQPLFPTPPTTAPAAGQLPFPVAELPNAAAIPQADPPAHPVPAQAPGQAPAPATAAPRLPRFFPAALATLAALLAVCGCFLPLFQMAEELTFRQGFGAARLTITETAWGTRVEISGQEPEDRPGVPVGIPVIVAIVLLAVAAFAAFSRPERGLTRWLLSAGAVFAAGVVTTIGMARFQLAAIAGEEVNLDVSTRSGMWLLVLATVAAAGAAVLVHLPLRRPGWADPAVAYADTPTPPSGVAITVLPPDEPDEPDEPGGPDREPPLR